MESTVAICSQAHGMDVAGWHTQMEKNMMASGETTFVMDAECTSGLLA